MGHRYSRCNLLSWNQHSKMFYKSFFLAKVDMENTDIIWSKTCSFRERSMGTKSVSHCEKNRGTEKASSLSLSLLSFSSLPQCSLVVFGWNERPLFWRALKLLGSSRDTWESGPSSTGQPASQTPPLLLYSWVLCSKKPQIWGTNWRASYTSAAWSSNRNLSKQE